MVAIWYLLLLFLAVQAYFIYHYFMPLRVAERKPKRHPLPVSVIICVKDESENLSKNLSFILNQKYHEFEVLVMDDHSSDNTAQFIKRLQKNHKNLKYVKASARIKDKVGKRWALAEAVEFSKHKHLLLTDADCRPSSLMWIEEMASRFSGKAAVVLGIGQYNLSGKWFDVLVQYETMFTALSYLGMAAGGKPYMGVGRNLAYQKRIFDKKIMEDERLVSGDDDMFIQHVARADNTVICTDQKAQTFSDPPNSFKQWIRQKTRHYSTASSYNRLIQMRLLLLKSSFYLPNFLSIYLLFAGFHIGLTLFLFLFRWLFWLMALKHIKQRLGFMRPIYLLPCYEIFFALFDLWIVIKNLQKTADWK
jgi:glycosyltransferase involved in cell wall biosynthesis